MKVFILVAPVLLVLCTGWVTNGREGEAALSERIYQGLKFYELRTYHAAPGKLDDLNARFRNRTMKLFEAHGIANIGYWVPTDNTNNVLIYLLGYPSREAREKSWKEFGADPEWQSVQKASEANGRLVTKVDSVYLTATDFSPLVMPSKAGEPRVFELRTYHATPGKLDNLLARFRDHTKALFEKHGMDQFGYWLPTETKDGAGETLIYILVHKSRAAADASWAAFRADPDWVKAKADSETNGPLTTKVESLFLTPTDYSPTK
jgi:hypothetical protein